MLLVPATSPDKLPEDLFFLGPAVTVCDHRRHCCCHGQHQETLETLLVKRSLSVLAVFVVYLPLIMHFSSPHFWDGRDGGGG